MSRRVDSRETAIIRDTGIALRVQHRRRSATLRTFCLATAASVMAIAPLGLAPVPRLIWNVSASAPVGLYLLSAPAGATVGDMVAVRVPAHARILATGRRYIAPGIPLIKRIEAADADEVCALGPTIFINGKPVAVRLFADSANRPLPWWQGCRVLDRDQIFLLMRGVPASFDGRYFGITRRQDLLGRVRLVWP